MLAAVDRGTSRSDDAAMKLAGPLDLRQRRQDIVWIVGFLAFACTSALVDRLAALDVDVCEAQSLGGSLCWYGRHIDPLYLANPDWLQVMSGISAYVFGPLYLLFAWAFWRGVEAVRGPALAWAVAILYSMLVHMWMEFRGPYPPPQPALLVAVYLPFVLLPLALIWRLRRPAAFQSASAAS